MYVQHQINANQNQNYSVCNAHIKKEKKNYFLHLKWEIKFNNFVITLMLKDVATRFLLFKSQSGDCGSS